MTLLIYCIEIDMFVRQGFKKLFHNSIMMKGAQQQDIFHNLKFSWNLFQDKFAKLGYNVDSESELTSNKTPLSSASTSTTPTYLWKLIFGIEPIEYLVGDQKVSHLKILIFGTSVRRSSRSAFGRPTGNNVSGHYKRHYFLSFFFPSSTFLIEGALGSKNLFRESWRERPKI